MGFFRKSKNGNYDFLTGYSWYVPGIGGMFSLLGWLLVGAVLGNLASLAVLAAFGQGVGMEYVELIAYPIMFIPAMIAARHISSRNMLFDDGFRTDSNNFAPLGALTCALLCMAATIALSWCMDPVSKLLPEMPESLENMFKSMTQDNFWINFLSVSIMAPIFEEWLCRGMVLRGLLNYERTDKDGNKVRGLKPWTAIVISAIFFGVIHLNPWQAIPAFALGCLFGYVYYRTGSLKLTMLMHFTNNTMALILGQTDSLKDAESLIDVMPGWAYACGFAAFVLFLCFFMVEFMKIPLVRIQGNSERISAEAEEV